MGNYAEQFQHFVWATKRRAPYITPEVETLLYDYMRHKCEMLRVVVQAINGMHDHVHLACTLPMTLAPSVFLERIKGASSHFINARAAEQKNITMCLYWQSGSGALSFAQHDLPRIVAYIDSQKRRHAEGRLSRKLEQCDDGYDAEPREPGPERLG